MHHLSPPSSPLERGTVNGDRNRTPRQPTTKITFVDWGSAYGDGSEVLWQTSRSDEFLKWCFESRCLARVEVVRLDEQGV